VDNIAGYEGGGIYFNTCEGVHMHDVRIARNSPEGILCYGSRIKIDSIIVEGHNDAAAINVERDSWVKLDNGLIQNNTNGGIHVEQSSLILSNTTVQANTAENGAGIYGDNCDLVWDDTLRFTNVVVADNIATYHGGGIYLGASSVEMEYTVLRGNQALHSDGGGLYMSYSFGSRISHTEVLSNAADQRAGGLYIKSSDPVFTDVSIMNNSSEWEAGGVYCTGPMSAIFSESTISGNSANWAGGLYASGESQPELHDCIIENNTAEESGGGIKATHGASLTLAGTTIRYNRSGTVGGGLILEGAVADFDTTNRCNIYLNRAQRGKDLYMGQSLTIPVVLDTFTVLVPNIILATCSYSSVAFDIQHGIIEQVQQDLYVKPSGSDEASGLTVNDPLQSISMALLKILPDSTLPLTIHAGDGVYSPSTTGEEFPLQGRSYMTLKGESREGTVLDADSMSYGVGIFSARDFHLSGVTITNGSGRSGGGISCSYSNATVENVNIIKNRVTSRGGGVCVTGLSNLRLSRVLIASNTSDNDGGGVYCGRDGTIELVNTSICNNDTENNGGGLTTAGRTNVMIINSILWDNTPTEFFLDPYNSREDTLVVAYSNIKGDTAGMSIHEADTVLWLEGNINADPVFSNPASGEYFLSAGSPCIDTGNPDSTFNDVEDPASPGNPLWPAMGTLRNDMGAYGGNPGSIIQWPLAVDDKPGMEMPLPVGFALYPAYPNPFNPRATIRYDLPLSSSVTLVVYDLQGREVRRLVEGHTEAGHHYVTWDGRDRNSRSLPSGIYIARLFTPQYAKSIKMVLLK
jgi:predicted outer membrane repeat protein